MRKGQKYSEESKLKISEAKKGENHPMQIKIDGFGKKFMKK